jgi:hypothetical protein
MSTLALSLFTLLIFFTTFILIIAWLHRRKHAPMYKAKGPYLLSAGERQFFDVLVSVLPPELYVCPKVRLADILTVTVPKSDKSYWKAFNQISQKHVDFLICQRSDFAPVVVIELDGGSHHDPQRIKRDRLVDNALREAGIRIEHIPVSSRYDQAELRRVIAGQ